MKILSIQELNEKKELGLKKLLAKERIRICVGLATCGISVGGDEVFETFKTKIEKNNLNVDLIKTGCIGYCKEEPIVSITRFNKGIILLSRVKPEDVDNILHKVLNDDNSFDKALCKIEKWDHLTTDTIDYGTSELDIPLLNEINFFKYQKKLVLRNAGLIDPENIDEYIAVGGYESLYKALTFMSQDDVIEEVVSSNLRGRGGAGFPTGVKWQLTKKEKSDVKYVMCNADEGDPGAYMNRNEMESDPHSVIEGMIIGGYAVGAKEGIIYVRAEYPLALQRLEKGIRDAKRYGFLGENIFGTDFSFDITIAKGAGAFVCGEETALIASVEGETGRPKPRPPFPSQRGLWNKPTNINNVETWTNIPVIIKKSGKWFSEIGSSDNAGTKVFSLVGKTNNVGLVEVELGVPISRIVDDIGEGAAGGKKVKAVQTGGPSGGCIPAKFFHTPIDYTNLSKLGSIMGSGGIVVMDEDTCMVDTAKFFLDFTVDESCGKCGPCREGLKHMHSILEKITEGKGDIEDINTLKVMANTIKKTALCGLGQTGPNPVLTTIEYFMDEYEAHTVYKKCLAKVCTHLIEFHIDENKCTGCTLCAKRCPTNAIVGQVKELHTIIQEKCVKCGTCLDVCNFNAVIKSS